MKPGKLFSTLAAMSLVLAVGCSSDKKKKDVNPVRDAITEANKTEDPTTLQTTAQKQMDFATVEFDRGEMKLSEMDRRHLNELAMKMTAAGKEVQDVKILTWADRVVNKDMEATNPEIILARQRGESIKEYLQRNLPAEEKIDFYNMAESPQRYSTYLQTKGIPANQAFTDEDGKQATPEGRSLVIIEYEGGPSSSQL